MDENQREEQRRKILQDLEKQNHHLRQKLAMDVNLEAYFLMHYHTPLQKIAVINFYKYALGI